MLKSKQIHPPIVEAPAATGRGGRILIADGNFAFSTNANTIAKRVHRNLMPGCMTVLQVREAILSAVSIERGDVMNTDAGEKPGIGADFHQLLPAFELQANERLAFTGKRLNVTSVW